MELNDADLTPICMTERLSRRLHTGAGRGPLRRPLTCARFCPFCRPFTAACWLPSACRQNSGIPLALVWGSGARMRAVMSLRTLTPGLSPTPCPSTVQWPSRAAQQAVRSAQQQGSPALELGRGGAARMLTTTILTRSWTLSWQSWTLQQELHAAQGTA